MVSQLLFQGAYTALITPFTADGEVDWMGLDRLIAYQIDQGIDGILACGTTGESPTLSREEHCQVIELCVTVADRRVPVIAGAGLRPRVTDSSEDERRTGRDERRASRGRSA